MTPTAKKTLLTFLVSTFAIQTALVYSDHRTTPLSDSAMRGRELWHKNACQVCHQLYGNGGFLGPDLTNAASRVDSIRLFSLLKEGSGQMPAFQFTDRQITDMRAYLKALDRPDLGRGQLRLGAASVGPWKRFGTATAVALARADPAVRRGFAVLTGRPCIGCHLPLAAVPGGAPDLSLAVRRLSPGELTAVLREGRPSKGMPVPTPSLSDEERAELAALFGWLSAQREELITSMHAAEDKRSLEWSAIPWWEYR